MKNIDEIDKELYTNGFLSNKSKQELKWHLGHDEDPIKAIDVITDACYVDFAPLMSKYLNHKDNCVRELTIGCLLGRLRLPEYGEAGLKMATKDEGGARTLALLCLGKVINDVDKGLKKDIAFYLLEVVNGKVYADDFHQGSAYYSMLDAMNVPNSKRPKSSLLSRIVDWDLGHIQV